MRFLVLSGFCILSACNYNYLKQNSALGSMGRGVQKMEAVDFNAIKTTVIGPKCLGCHANETGNKGGANLESYENVRRLMSRIVFRCLEKGDMPPSGPLSSEESQTLKDWFEMGAPESAVDTQSQADPTLEQGPTDWQKIREKIFRKKCLDCHSQPQPQANLDLENYDEVKEKITAIFDRVIVKQNMPMEPYPAMSMRERKVFLNWLNMGMPK